jgi:murein DD-endopeptidase MepM/ murein hydrolase activator NlpD
VTAPGADVGALEGSEFLRKAGDVLSAVSSELKLQQQSYEQIARKHEYNKKYFASLPAIKPIRGWYSAGKFGMRMHPILGIVKNHRGLDIVADVGTEVVASGDGVVSMAGHSGGGLGNIVVIDHGFGYQTVYAHLSKITTKRGKSVKRGDVIAKSGKTGLTSGPHLHYEVRHNGRPKNPADFFFDDVSPEEIRALRAERPGE